MASYHHNLNRTLKGEEKRYGGKRTRAYQMKLVRYISRVIHGK
ncbi:hypothetical protein ALP12_200366 [Pseudomonas savastanoi pv. phaseolicola]|uniref:Uncharacterized protein n=3 Tax=Pseudomonas syringae group genomosp. 2 TaxID=251698 RepID=A0A3M5BXB2_PSESS|nr:MULTISPECIES: hypothetical protein [Pseudomonas syringae group]KPC18644.1 Unknown protein sequence [Pseudomonas syringae pv. maculicola]KPX77977.1 hypothetical protein ALO53_200196 [Pseudomonas amygdali pv. photiniae]RMS28948.1 hypothetical protein ALP70_02714 [Pseudomonas savastanoi]RMV34037.1 hypothetical protein ALP12_200366 [Pseudomonas savastanoi pv. phaseolicola]